MLKERENKMETRAVCACVLCFKGSLSFQDVKKHPWASETMLGDDTLGCQPETRILVGGLSLYFGDLCAPLHASNTYYPI